MPAKPLASRNTRVGGSEVPAVQVRGLVKAYDGTPAVAGIDLDIHRGEIFALLGPNGAGKTTTVDLGGIPVQGRR